MIKVQSSKFKVQSYIKENSGQVVLILVLITVIGITIGLSLISRTITDVKISSQIEESNRAFSVAEAGIENALRSSVIGGPTGTVTLGTGASASYSVSPLGGATTTYNFPNTPAGRVQIVWFVDHNSDDTLNEASTYPAGSPVDICWGGSSTNTSAISMTLFYKDGSSYKIAKAAYDPKPTADGHNANNFYSVDFSAGGYCNGNYLYKVEINQPAPAEFWNNFIFPAGAKLIFLILQPVYSDTAIGIKPQTATSLQVQGKQIISQGQTSTGVVRKIQVSKGYSTLPEIYNFTFFSQ